MIKGVLFCIAIYLSYQYGWVKAHRMVAMECRKNGGFFVGKSTFKCHEISDKPDDNE